MHLVSQAAQTDDKAFLYKNTVKRHKHNQFLTRTFSKEICELLAKTWKFLKIFQLNLQ